MSKRAFSVRHLLPALLGLYAGLALPACAHAATNGASLVTELATNHVDITTRFTGEKILVFGAVSQPGNVIIKVKSPTQTVALSRKVKIGPFWLSSGKIQISHTPGLLYLLSSAPIDDVLPAAIRDRYDLSLTNATKSAKTDGDSKDMRDWPAALIRLKRHAGQYQQGSHAVSMKHERLFYATLDLPAKLPLGDYQVQFYLVSDGKIVAQQSRNLNVRQVHVERWMSDTARNDPWTFGIAYTLGAMILGLVLGMVLQRDRDD